MIGVGVLVLGLGVAGAASGEDILKVVAASQLPWQPYKIKRGVAVERRAVAGSAFYEYRARAEVPKPPATLFESMWGKVAHSPGPMVKKRQMLSQEPNTLVFYDQVRTPVVSDRDYTMRMYRRPLGSERYEMVFETANQLGPPPQPNHVRIPAILGKWLLEPLADKPGWSRVTYQTYSEPGGSVPAFIIAGPQAEQVARSIEALK